jgi:phosphate transport system permease protein
MTVSRLPNETNFRQGLAARNHAGTRWQGLFLASTLAGLVMLVILILSVLNEMIGIVAVRQEIETYAVTDGREVEQLSEGELGAILQTQVAKGRLRGLFTEVLLPANADRAALGTEPIENVLNGQTIPAEVAGKKFTELTEADLGALFASNLSKDQLVGLVNAEVLKIEVLQNWTLFYSLFNRSAIEQSMSDTAAGLNLSSTLNEQQQQELMAKYATAHLEWRSWLNADLFTNSMAKSPTEAGLRGALVGTLLVLSLTMLIAAPLGIGAAIYLEEYAKDLSLARGKTINTINQIIETNIRNLAGVPSIIYGLLGLAVFARTFGFFTSGTFLTGEEGNGRTILTAAFTLALVILPVIIINAQEAIRAVPSTIREASYGLGATKWQTIWNQVLPAALPGILTGIILSLSRAIGETAPLVVVGAAVFLSQDPNGPFSPFTTLPIQIYNWAAEPDRQFRALQAAGIIALLGLLVTLNAAAIIIRQRYSRKLQG